MERVIKHPNYDEDNVDSDLALLKISITEFEENSKGYKSRSAKRYRQKKMISQFTPACLPEQDEQLPAVNTHCTIIGWGKQNDKHPYGTDVLHEAEVINYTNFDSF